MKHKKKYNPKDCDNYLPAGACSDDGGKPTCLAHIAEGRIFDCVLETLGNAYCDFEPKIKSSKVKNFQKGDIKYGRKNM